MNVVGFMRALAGLRDRLAFQDRLATTTVLIHKAPKFEILRNSSLLSALLAAQGTRGALIDFQVLKTNPRAQYQGRV